MMQQVMTVLKTVKVEYTQAASIKCTAREDVPAYGLKKDQVFFLVRSSKDDGTYYLVVWSYEECKWSCGCPATVRQCRHIKLVNARCKKMQTVQNRPQVAAQPVQPVVQSTVVVEKPVERRTSVLNGNRSFSFPPTWAELEAEKKAKKEQQQVAA